MRVPGINAQLFNNEMNWNSNTLLQQEGISVECHPPAFRESAFPSEQL